MDNVEALANQVLDRRLSAWNAALGPHHREDAIAYLVATCWELSEKYDPSRGLSFSTYAYRMLSLRVADWYRATFGDNRRRKRQVQLVSLDGIKYNEPSATEDGYAAVLDRLAARDRAAIISELSEEGRETVAAIVIPLSEGSTYAALRAELGLTHGKLKRRLEQLDRELEDLAAGNGAGDKLPDASLGD